MDSEFLTRDLILDALGPSRRPPIYTADVVASTNDWAKELGLAGAPHGTTVFADAQTKGRGRQNKQFASPAGHGIYMSMVLRPSLSVEQVPIVTLAAAVAVCRAIEAQTSACIQIKWPNDLLLQGKKVCGILSELVLSSDTSELDFLVVGIGLNYSTPPSLFPEEVRQTACSLQEVLQANSSKSGMAAQLITQLLSVMDELPNRSFMPFYRSKSLLLGKPIVVYRGGTSQDATAEDVTEDGGLLVRWPNGSAEVLHSGEVSVRPQNIHAVERNLLL